MKRRFIVVLVTLSFAVTLAAISAIAQSKQRLTFDVPFSFVVEGKTLQPGRYTVERFDANVPGTLVLKGVDGRTIKAFRTTRVEASEPEQDAKLTFMRFGNENFLSEVWTGGERNGRRLPRSEAENELRQQGRTAETLFVRNQRPKKR